MIAAARLGQRVASVGQLGEDVYGAFFRRVMQVPTAVHLWRRLFDCTQWKPVLAAHAPLPPPSMLHTLAGNSSFCGCNLWCALQQIVLAVRVEQPTHASCHFCPQEEGVNTIEALSPAAAREFATLLCFVLVSPAGGHAFTSAYDFGPWPLLAGVAELQPRVLEASNVSVLGYETIVMHVCLAGLPCQQSASCPLSAAACRSAHYSSPALHQTAIAVCTTSLCTCK
jgi:hypothetical protein